MPWTFAAAICGEPWDSDGSIAIDGLVSGLDAKLDPGIEPESSRMSSKVASSTDDVVAPKRVRSAGVVQVPVAVEA